LVQPALDAAGAVVTVAQQPFFAVIGSNSFSGSSFVSHLLKAGHQVVGVSRSEEPHHAFLPYRWTPAADRFQFHQLDLNQDLEQICDLINETKSTHVLNFASQSMVAESWLNPDHWYMTNVVSTVRLHEALRKMPHLIRHVHISTPEVYGSTSGDVVESAPFNPSTPYAVSRAAADMNLRVFHANYGFPVVYTRAANVFGPGQQLYRIIPRTILAIRLGQKLMLHGGGVSERSFIHIDDVSDATLRIALDGRDGEAYHIATGRQISIRALVEMICARMGVAFDDVVEVVGERAGKDAAYRLNSSKLRAELGWSDKVSLEQGVDETIAWVDQNLETLKTLPQSYVHKP
jgi:dTDP-glucose 4,6-dehydratase